MGILLGPPHRFRGRLVTGLGADRLRPSKPGDRLPVDGSTSASTCAIVSLQGPVRADATFTPRMAQAIKIRGPMAVLLFLLSRVLDRMPRLTSSATGANQNGRSASRPGEEIFEATSSQLR